MIPQIIKDMKKHCKSIDITLDKCDPCPYTKLCDYFTISPSLINLNSCHVRKIKK